MKFYIQTALLSKNRKLCHSSQPFDAIRCLFDPHEVSNHSEAFELVYHLAGSNEIAIIMAKFIVLRLTFILSLLVGYQTISNLSQIATWTESTSKCCRKELARWQNSPNSCMENLAFLSIAHYSIASTQIASKLRFITAWTERTSNCMTMLSGRSSFSVIRCYRSPNIHVQIFSYGMHSHFIVTCTIASNSD